jgi:hypothetical protein
VEVPALRFKGVDVQVRDIDVACAQTLGRELARIGTAAGVGDLIAATMRQRESRVAGADGCQEPSWNENMKVFSGLAINSENISHDILTIDGLVRSAAFRVWPPYKFRRSFVDPQKGCFSHILEHRLIGQHTRQPSEQRRPPNMPQRWMSKFSQLMAKSPLFIKLSGYSQISWLSLSD